MVAVVSCFRRLESGSVRVSFDEVATEAPPWVFTKRSLNLGNRSILVLEHPPYQLPPAETLSSVFYC